LRKHLHGVYKSACEFWWRIGLNLPSTAGRFCCPANQRGLALGTARAFQNAIRATRERHKM